MIITPKHIRTSSELFVQKIGFYIPDTLHIDYYSQVKIIINIY
jgi:hypothetical protein